MVHQSSIWFGLTKKSLVMRINSIEVPCTFCGQKIKECCTYSNGIPRLGYVHKARAKLAATVLTIMKTANLISRGEE